MFYLFNTNFGFLACSVFAKSFVDFYFSMYFLVQTDMMDLLGSDLPVESDEGMKFSWSDGILLQVGMS